MALPFVGGLAIYSDLQDLLSVPPVQLPGESLTAHAAMSTQAALAASANLKDLENL